MIHHQLVFVALLAVAANAALGESSKDIPASFAWKTSGPLVTCGSPGVGKLVFLRPEDTEPFYSSTKFSNCQSVSFHAPTWRLAMMSTNRNSNLNGRAVDKDGNYVGNQSPITLFELPG